MLQVSHKDVHYRIISNKEKLENVDDKNRIG